MPGGLSELAFTVAYGLLGWALCGGTMEIAMATTNPSRAFTHQLAL